MPAVSIILRSRPGENRVFGEQLGPGRASRAMAIVHIAMFDALDAVVGGYTSYTGTQAAPGPMSVDAAISQAARDTLAAMFPSQTPTFDAYLAEDLAACQERAAKSKRDRFGATDGCRHSGDASQRWFASSRARPSASIIFRAINPGTGGRIQ